MALLAVIVPVLNERANVEALIRRLDAALPGVAWELVFVDDDSPDGTAALVRRIARTDPRVRVLQRVGRRGLASACVEGFLSTSAPYLAVMDGDLQHDETVLPAMLELARSRKLELVVASRNLTPDGMGAFAKRRVWLSNLGRSLSRLVTGTELSDPMSGFFLIDRRLLDQVVRDLSQIGFKILLDIVASCPRKIRFAEVPYTFRNREHGESKLDSSVSLDYLLLIADKLTGDFVPVRFVLYSMVGLSGVLVHFLLLNTAYQLAREPLLIAQAMATFGAMIWNFFLNNAITYRDRKLRGWFSLGRGLTMYVAGCSVGALANLALTKVLADEGYPWYAAGGFGLLISTIWNFAIAEMFAWKIARRRRRYAKQQWQTYAAAEDGPLQPGA